MDSVHILALLHGVVVAHKSLTRPRVRFSVRTRINSWIISTTTAIAIHGDHQIKCPWNETENSGRVLPPPGGWVVTGGAADNGLSSVIPAIQILGIRIVAVFPFVSLLFPLVQ